MDNQIQKIANMLSAGNIAEATSVLKGSKVSKGDIAMPIIQESAKMGMFLSLSKGDIDGAFNVYELVIAKDDEEEILEIMTIIRQAITDALKNGYIHTALEIKDRFNVPQGMINETLKQAILSNFRDGNIQKITEIRDEFPVTKKLANEVIEYCATWGKPNTLSAIQSVFVFAKAS